MLETTAAERLKFASMMFAAFVARSKVVDFDLMRESIKKEFAKKPKFIPLNMEAVEQGKGAATRQ